MLDGPPAPGYPMPHVKDGQTQCIRGLMNLLFVHQNYPGQFRESLPKLAATGKHTIVFITQRKQVPANPVGHRIIQYNAHHVAKDDTYAYAKMFENACGTGVGAARACAQLKKEGFTPDLIVGHIGWGEMMFLKEVWPETPMAGYFEYYFIPKGGAVGHDPEFPERGDISALLHARNAPNYLSYVRCDAGFTASDWQKSTFPELLQSKIQVLHEGIRTDLLHPDHDSPIEVPLADPPFRRGDEIVTYVARNLEPIRGVHTFLRCLPRLLHRRPKARIAIIGGDQTSYGPKLAEGKTYVTALKQELGKRVDWSRVHFLGQIDYKHLMNLIKLSSCHVYLTVPFVVSWSLFEAMALEKTIVASDVAPVRDVIEDGSTGFLVDFFSPQKLAEKIGDVLAHPDHFRSVGETARRHVVEKYDFQTICFPQFVAFLNSVLEPYGKRIEM